jgi:hypothetical protein
VVEKELRDASVVWQAGDPWRVLTAEIQAAQEATIVTMSGAARLVRWGERGAWHTRIPIAGGHRIGLDESWGRLDVLEASPCGVRVVEPDHMWFASTPIVLVLRGLHPRWVDSQTGQRALEQVWAGTIPDVPGHPAQRCSLPQCALTDS